MNPIFYVLIFLATVLAAESIYFATRSDASTRAAVTRRRLDRISKSLQSTETSATGESLLRKGESRGLAEHLLDALPQREAIGLLVYRAGATTTPARLVTATVALIAGGFLIGAFVMSDPIKGFLFSTVGIFPWWLLRRNAKRRMAAFEQQLPDALALMTRAMRAGHSLAFGLRMVAEELPDPIGAEFTRVADEVHLGQDLLDALTNLNHRLDVPDLPFFVTSIGIQRETGGNLTEILDKLGYVIRERFKLYGKVSAITAMGRASANLLAMWPFVMVGSLYVANRDYVAPLWETPGGHQLVMISAVLVVVGYVLCRRMAEIEV